MAFQRRDIINTLWALLVPFPIASICFLLIAGVALYTPLITFTSETGGPPAGQVAMNVSSVAALLLSCAIGYMFARRVFPRHAIAVAILYFPAMYYVLGKVSWLIPALIFRE